MTSLRVHFDGRVLVPEGPVDLPVGESVQVILPTRGDCAENAQSPDELLFDVDPATGFPMFRVPPGTPQISLEEIQKAQDEF